MFIDTHAHLDAVEFDADRAAAHLRARAAGVAQSVIPAVEASNFDTVRLLAHAHQDAYALGIHPLYTPQATEAHLTQLDATLLTHRNDPRLVAVGEIGLDGFVPELNTPEALAKQQLFYKAQLKLAQQHQLPVILHVRRSADLLLKGLRDTPVVGGVAHAFNGSLQQAQAFIALGFKLGFGGALTYDRALQLRRLATELPLSAIVLETDAPDIPPHWLYTTAEQRAAGQPQGRNEPAELPRIAQVLADLRGISLDALAAATSANAREALPRLQ
jgi:TatD DNase family protein